MTSELSTTTEISMTSDIFFKAILPFISLLIGAFISYLSSRLLHTKNSKRQLAIELYEEFHSDAMLECRLAAGRVLAENDEGNLEELYRKLPEDKYIPLSKLFHWFEKVGIYEKNQQIDASLLKELLGRYIHEWYRTHHERLVKGLRHESEFTDMMEQLKYVAFKMGKRSETTFFTQKEIEE